MLPSYELCKDICEKSNGVFYETVFSIDGYKVSIFNYRLATYQDFFNHNAFELRGLTFVFGTDGQVFKRFPLLEKFFNLNENESTLYESIKDKKIRFVYNKEDGSIISFIKLPNGKVLAKSKNSLFSDQARMAQNIYENNQNIKDNVDLLLNFGLNPIFELVGPKNMIVLKYPKTKLVLLSLRNDLGVYNDIKNIDLEKPSTFNFTLHDLIKLKSKLENIEGWVVEFEDGQKVKIKTDWYISLHRILTDYSNREDYLIDLILDEKIDDILSVLDFGSENRKFVEDVILKTNNKVNGYIFEINNAINRYNGDKKQFAIEFKDHELFSIMAKCLNGGDVLFNIKEYVKKKTYRLFGAKQWLDF